jgi:hypothetical protein
MKIPLIYGGIAAFAMIVLALINHILGLSTDPDKMMIGAGVGSVGMLAIYITMLIIGTKAARAQRAPAEGFTYGQAFSTAILIVLFGALFTSVFYFIYYKFIFPNFAEVQIEWMRSFMEKMNAPAAKIEEAVEKMREKSTVVAAVRSAFIFTVCLGAVVSLITSAVLKRAPVEDLSAPPPVA